MEMGCKGLKKKVGMEGRGRRMGLRDGGTEKIVRDMTGWEV